MLYSNIAEIKGEISDKWKFYLIQGDAESGVSLACTIDKDYSGKIVIYNIAGQALEFKNVQLNKGMNIVELPQFNSMKNEVLVVSLFINNQLAFTQKALY
jgi:hypothetical protein